MTKWVLLFLFGANLLMAQDVEFINNTIKIADEFELVTPLKDHQYLAAQWARAKLFYANGTTNTYDSLNFNRYSNEIEVVLNNKVVTLRAMAPTAALIYKTENSGSLLIVGNINNKNLFLLVKSAGKYVLASYLTTNTTEKEEDMRKVDEVRFVPKQKDKVEIFANYVLRKGDDWRPFKISKSSILKLFKIDKNSFQNVLKTQGMNAGEKEELVKIFDILNDN